MALALTFIHPALEVTIQVPAAAVSAVSLAVSTALDSRRMNSTLFDGVNTIDLATISIIKALADMTAASDNQPVFSMAKVIGDTAIARDAPAIVAQFFRTFNDVVSAADLSLIVTGKVLSDAASVSDGVQIVAGKIISDGTTSSDVVVLSSTKMLADSIATSDSKEISVNKVLSETPRAIDTGRIVLTDYTDISYFADDFVGTTRIF